MGACMECGNRRIINRSNRKVWASSGEVSKEKREIQLFTKRR